EKAARLEGVCPDHGPRKHGRKRSERSPDEQAECATPEPFVEPEPDNDPETDCAVSRQCDDAARSAAPEQERGRNDDEHAAEREGSQPDRIEMIEGDDDGG